MVKFYTPQVYTRKDGKIELYIRYTDPSFNGVRKKSTILQKNTTIARNKATKEVKDKIVKSLKYLTLKKITFDDLTKLYLENLKAKDVHHSTVRGRTSIFNILGKIFAGQIVSTITAVQINKVLNDALYKEGLANATVAGYKTALSQLFKYALNFGYIKENPMLNVSVDFKNEASKKKERIENYYLSDDEFQTILNYCKNKGRTDYCNLFTWLYLTGMRVGEAVSLTPNDIFEENEITYAKVTGTMIYTSEKGWHKQNTTKTVAGTRNVALPTALTKMLSHLLNDQNNHTPFIFYSFYNKKCFNPHSVFYFMNRLEKKTGLRHFGTHIFRHTHISKLAERGYPLELISKRVGHEDSEITRKIYLHVTKKAQLNFDKSIQDLKV